MANTNGSAAIDWDDARVFLAVARHGSLRAAGRALGLSQPTIGRRLAAFEAAFGGPALFDRLPEGLRLNGAGEALLAAAEELEDAALALERRHAAGSPQLSGTVRVSVGEWAARFLADNLGRASAAPLPSGITVELVESRETANLARREADLAVRHHPPESGDLYMPSSARLPLPSIVAPERISMPG
jgi:DNA-binding transcriptional LysR family regulator